MTKTNYSKKAVIFLATIVFTPLSFGQNSEPMFEEIIVTAEKRSESLQDLSQAVTVLSGVDLDNRQISTFVDLSAIAPGVNIAKNEGFKTVITIGALVMKQIKTPLQRHRSLII
jgi:iron complex outermembrane receptor protein